MSDDKVINMPDTFRPIGDVASKLITDLARGLSHKAADTLDQEAAQLECAARLKRFAAEQIRKGAPR